MNRGGLSFVSETEPMRIKPIIKGGFSPMTATANLAPVNFV